MAAIDQMAEILWEGETIERGRIVNRAGSMSDAAILRCAGYASTDALFPVAKSTRVRKVMWHQYDATVEISVEDVQKRLEDASGGTRI